MRICANPGLRAAVGLAVLRDEGVGRGVVREGGLLLGDEFAHDLLREDLAELDAPLVEGVDVPDDALDEDLVLVERDERAEREGRELVGEQRVRRAVAGEGLLRDKRLGDALGADFIGRLAEAISFDKKKTGGNISFVLPVKIGEAVIRPLDPETILKAAVQ